MTEILVVEDNPADVRMVRLALEEAGDWQFRIEVADDGEKAIQYIQRTGVYNAANPPDLVILDLNLPKYPGVEVLKVIRETEATRDVSVAVLSSSPEDAIRGQFKNLDLKADCYFTKPADFDEYLALGRNILDCYRRRTSDS